jgi:hypothetical protein
MKVPFDRAEGRDKTGSGGVIILARKNKGMK